MNLKQAKQRGKLDQFIAEHPITDPHPMGKERFETLLDLMTRGGKPPSAQTSTEAPSASYAGTRTRKGTSKDASD